MSDKTKNIEVDRVFVAFQQFSLCRVASTVTLERSARHPAIAKTQNFLLRRLIELVAGLFFIAVAGDSGCFLPFHYRKFRTASTVDDGVFC